MKIQRSRDWVLSQFVSEGNIVSIKNEIKKKFWGKTHWGSIIYFYNLYSSFNRKWQTSSEMFWSDRRCRKRTSGFHWMIGNVKYISLPDLEDTEGHCIQCIRDIPMIILTDRYITSMWSLYRERSTNHRSLYTGQLRYSDWSVCGDKTLYCI